MAQSAGTEFGRQHGLDAQTTYEKFCDQVPIRAYDYFEPLIQRMATGEADVLVPDRCPLFVETAGATGAKPKILPVPATMLAHFRQGLRDALFHYARRAGRAHVFLGRHVHIGASTTLREEQGTWRSSVDGIFSLCLTPWAEANLRSPPLPIAQLPEGAEKIKATAAAVLQHHITLVAGLPASVCAFAREAISMRRPDTPHLQTIWPNLECFLHTGAPLGLSGEALRHLLGPTIRFHEIYTAAEGIFAAQDSDRPAALRLLADSGIFFEFLPLFSYHEATFAKTGALCVPLEKVQRDTDYVLIVTTPAGLCRYMTGDIVRFFSVAPPRIQFIGRTALQLNTFGERVSERDVFETIQAVCLRNGWQVMGFHVAPYEQRIAAGQVANVHEWWLELGTHSVKTPMANVLGPEFDAELCQQNNDYAIRRKNNVLGPPQIRLLVPGVFERWAQEQHKTASASKLPRCRSDRLIADQLAALAPFHQPTIAPAKGPSDGPSR